jgi:hypothetical protein
VPILVPDSTDQWGPAKTSSAKGPLHQRINQFSTPSTYEPSIHLTWTWISHLTLLVFPMVDILSAWWIGSRLLPKDQLDEWFDWRTRVRWWSVKFITHDMCTYVWHWCARQTISPACPSKGVELLHISGDIQCHLPQVPWGVMRKRWLVEESTIGTRRHIPMSIMRALLPCIMRFSVKVIKSEITGQSFRMAVYSN